MVLFETTTIHSSLLHTSLLFHCFVIGEHGCGRNGAFVENGLDDAAFIHSCAVVCHRYGSGPALVSSCPRRRGTAVVFPRERGKILYIRSFCSHVAPGIMLGHSILDVYASLFLCWFCRHCPRPPPFHWRPLSRFCAWCRGAGEAGKKSLADSGPVVCFGWWIVFECWGGGFISRVFFSLWYGKQRKRLFAWFWRSLFLRLRRRPKDTQCTWCVRYQRAC